MTVTVQYRTQKLYCSCCNQALPEPKISDVQNFEFTKDTALSWSSDWNELTKYEDLDAIVEEFVYETISFHSWDSNASFQIEASENLKVQEMILREFPPAPDEDEDE